MHIAQFAHSVIGYDFDDDGYVLVIMMMIMIR